MTTQSLIGALGGHTLLLLGMPSQVEAFFQALATPGLRWPAQVPPEHMPAFMFDKKRPLADYDALQGAPFWLR